MSNKDITSVHDIPGFKPERDRLHSATHDEIRRGWTTDVYFAKTLDVLRALGLEETDVIAEVFCNRPGVISGIDQVVHLLRDREVRIWGLSEGEEMHEKEVVMRIEGRYADFGVFETALLGILASSSGWSTAARACRLAAGDKGVISFGARHVHPAVAPVMEFAALTGGCDGVSCVLAAALAGREPIGTIPHACFLIAGDTLRVARMYPEAMSPGTPTIVLVDTFKDEVEETLRVAREIGPRLDGIRLDTPSERGGVTPALVREIKEHLRLEGLTGVRIIVSGGLDPERIRTLSEAGADVFGVGSYISAAPPIDMTMDIKEVEGRPIAKRGRIPGRTASPRLKRLL